MSFGDYIEIKKEEYVGKRCFIVATGPSLAYKDMSFLKDEYTIGVNISSLMFDIWGFKPTFNVVADKYICPHYESVLRDLIVGSSTIKIVVASACETYPKSLVDSKTFFYPKKRDQDVIDFEESPLENGFCRGKTVTYDAIQLAYYLGFSEVYVLGMDMTINHDWGKNGHCYEIQKNEHFPNIDFFKTDSRVIQRGLVGNPHYRDYIGKLVMYAQKLFTSKNRTLLLDSRSQLEGVKKIDVLKKFGNHPKVAAVVPAKSTSNRIPNKNIKKLGGKSLYLHIVDTLLQCITIDEVYVDTESDELFSLIGNRPVKRIKRPKELATNATDGNNLMLFEADQIETDILIQCMATSPFMKVESVNEAVYKLITSKDYDSIFTVHKTKHYTWKDEVTPNYDIVNIPNSVDLPDSIIEVMNFYAVHKKSLLETKLRLGKKYLMYPVSLFESIDIDTPEEFELAEIVYEKINGDKSGND